MPNVLVFDLANYYVLPEVLAELEPFPSQKNSGNFSALHRLTSSLADHSANIYSEPGLSRF